MYGMQCYSEVSRCDFEDKTFGHNYEFKSLREVMAKANEEKSGDKLAGIAAEDAQERVAGEQQERRAVVNRTGIARIEQRPRAEVRRSRSSRRCVRCGRIPVSRAHSGSGRTTSPSRPSRQAAAAIRWLRSTAASSSARVTFSCCMTRSAPRSMASSASSPGENCAVR